MKKIYIVLAAIIFIGVVACSDNKSGKNEITSYSLAGVAGTINEEEKTIAVEVPYNADVTVLIAIFTTTGGRVKVGGVEQVSGTTINDFTSPLTYTVTAENGSKANYTVTVTLAPSPEKAITAYSLAGVTGTINEEEKTIKIAMPSETDFTALTATFTTTGASVNIGATGQISGTTANNFTSPLTYTVTAEDGSKVDYIVTAGVAIKTWQTYCGSEPGRLHLWRHITGNLTVESLPLVSATFHSGYVFTQDGKLIASDRTSGKQFYLDDQVSSFVPMSAKACPQFSTATHTFKQERNQVAACPIYGGDCKIIAITEASWPYVFAEHNGSVLAATNYGDVLIFNGTDWCRCSRSGDTYRCDPNEPMLTEGRGVQFYSSIEYMGKTLVGEWPTGRIYEFDGKELHPADMHQPPFVTGESIGYEAQSMAEYCGDLFVGYWPRGEVWRLDRNTGNWSMAVRLFSHPIEKEPFIPYTWRPVDDMYWAFYGQRITSLVPFGDSLFAATSNYQSWPVEYESKIMAKDQAAEYGTIYRLTIPGCQTIEP